MNHVDIKIDNTLEKRVCDPIKSVSLHKGTVFMDKGEQAQPHVGKRRGTDGVNAASEQ